MKDRHPLLPPVVESRDLPVHGEEPLCGGWARRTPQHAEFGFGPAVGHGRIDEHRVAVTGGDDVLPPQVAVGQAWRLRRDQVGQGRAQPFEGSALLTVERRLDQRFGQPAQEASFGEEGVAVLLPGVVLAQAAEPAVAVPAEPVADGRRVQGGDHVREPLPELLVVAARLHLLEYEQPFRGEQHVGGVHPAEDAKLGETDGLDGEDVQFLVEQGLGEQSGAVLERDQPGDGDHAPDGPLDFPCGITCFTEPVGEDRFMVHAPSQTRLPFAVEPGRPETGEQSGSGRVRRLHPHRAILSKIRNGVGGLS